MRQFSLRAALCAAFLAVASAQPTITGWQNNYSYGLPGTPNYAVAQGSIIVVYGSNMAPAGVLSQGFNPALSKNLGGVSLKITVNGTTTEGVPYYVSPGQIAAILPSATPVGNGTMTVTYNGQTSAGFAIRVVQGAVGLLTLNGAGNGTAAVYDANYKYVTFTSSAAPGQTVIFWGTGIGADPNEETRLIASPQSLSNSPFEFYIGSKLATVAYHGRSAYPGLDQMNVVIPQGVSGCYVSAYAKTGNIISNFTTIPVASSGGVCSDTNGLSSSEVTNVLSRADVRAGWLYLGRFTSRVPASTTNGVAVPASTTISDSATAQFLRYTPFDYTNYGGQGQPSIGSCVVSSYDASTPPQLKPLQYLDAGTITLALPDGSVRTLTKGNSSYFLNGSSASSLFIPETGGTFQFSRTGGAEIGPFTTLIGSFSPLIWTNRGSLVNVNRAQSLEVTWSGGAPDSYVVITGATSTPTNPAVATTFACTAAVSAGRFTIPADVLSSILPSAVIAGSTLPNGQLSIANYQSPLRFTASGLDTTWMAYFTSESSRVNYQ